MTCHRRKGVKLDPRTGRLEADPDLPLLVDRKQDVGLYADHQRVHGAETGKRRGDRAAVLREIELVHCARQGEKAVRVEDLRETFRLVVEIGLDFEAAWVTIRPAGSDDPPPKSRVELTRAAVRDGPELTCEAKSCARPATGFVLAVSPLRVAAHDLTLQRAERDRLSRCADRA